MRKKSRLRALFNRAFTSISDPFSLGFWGEKTFLLAIVFLALVAVLPVVKIFLTTDRVIIQMNNAEVAEAISLIKEQYPSVRDYPDRSDRVSNTFPPRLVKNEKIGNLEHIAFIQLGSGRRILNALCFEFNLTTKKIRARGEFLPSGKELSEGFSLIDCRPLK